VVADSARECQYPGRYCYGVLLAFKLEHDSEIADKIAAGAFLLALAIDFIPASNDYSKRFRSGRFGTDPHTGMPTYFPGPPPKLSEFPLWADWIWPAIKELIRGTALLGIAFCIIWAGLRLSKFIRNRTFRLCLMLLLVTGTVAALFTIARLARF